MDTIEQAIIDTLNVNMGYKKGEDVLIVRQDWREHIGADKREEMKPPAEVADRMVNVLARVGVKARLINYIPEKGNHGEDAPSLLYAWCGLSEPANESTSVPDIVFMPTAFSLTHTPFRKALTDNGARVASMPTFTLDMFAEGGPMAADYKMIAAENSRLAEQLQSGEYVRVQGEGTNIVIQIDRSLITKGDGFFHEKGEYGNLPGGETFVVPVHLGNSNGYLTVPTGWGGHTPLEHAATFYVKDGRFTEIKGDSPEAQAYLDEKVKPIVFGGDDYNVLAELGIGTNENVTAEYIAKHGWSPLTAEKIVGSAHFANGNSKGMGGQNDVPIHMDWVVPGVQITFDYKPKE